MIVWLRGLSSSSYCNTCIPINLANLFKLSTTGSFFSVNIGKFKITSVLEETTHNCQETLAYHCVLHERKCP